jgi:hypothetical protein
MDDRSGHILQLCALRRQAMQRPDGGLVIDLTVQSYQLLRNGYPPHDLNYRELRAAICGLTDVLLHPGLNTVIDLDHQEMWAWVAEVLIRGRQIMQGADERELRRLFETTSHAVVAGASDSEEARDRHRKSVWALEHHSQEVLIRTHEMLPYLGFPLLEGVLRRACSDYVTLDGFIIKSFSVPRWANGPSRLYSERDRCTNLGHVLRLLCSTVAGPELRSDLASILTHIAELSGKDGIDTLAGWRNTSLHGEASLPTIGGTLLNLSILVILDGASDAYEEIRAHALEGARFEVGRRVSGVSPSPSSFYPIE